LLFSIPDKVKDMNSHPHKPHFPHTPHHHHSHSHDYKSLDRKKLLWSMGITVCVMFLEIGGGIISNSIALLSDAGYMFSHFFALLISYIAIRLAAMEPCHHRTYGLFRAEVLASLLNGVFLLGVTAIIVYESIQRLLEPEEIASRQMFIIAFIGLTVNLITILILRDSKKDDRNIKAAFMHMIADAISSIGVVGGAIIIHYTDLVFIDPLLGIAISILILIWAWGLIKDAVRVLLEYAPRGMETDKIKKLLQENDERIIDITDMHVIEITNGMYDLSATIVVSTESLKESGEIIQRANELLLREFNINHSTIQPVCSKSNRL
jgi:cobalt-zinc-cadmium efflux system protein